MLVPPLVGHLYRRRLHHQERTSQLEHIAPVARRPLFARIAQRGTTRQSQVTGSQHLTQHHSNPFQVRLLLFELYAGRNKVFQHPLQAILETLKLMNSIGYHCFGTGYGSELAKHINMFASGLLLLRRGGLGSRARCFFLHAKQILYGAR